jgi:hypothetical protein
MQPQAAWLLGAVEGLCYSFAATVEQVDHMNWDHIEQSLFAHLDKQALAAAWAEGQTLSKEQAVALVLEIIQAVHKG